MLSTRLKTSFPQYWHFSAGRLFVLDCLAGVGGEAVFQVVRLHTGSRLTGGIYTKLKQITVS